jgi:hypothetical protein
MNPFKIGEVFFYVDTLRGPGIPEKMKNQIIEIAIYLQPYLKEIGNYPVDVAFELATDYWEGGKWRLTTPEGHIPTGVSQYGRINNMLVFEFHHRRNAWGGFPVTRIFFR